MMATEHRECNQSQSKCKQTRTNVHVLDTYDYKLDHAENSNYKVYTFMSISSMFYLCAIVFYTGLLL